MPRHASAPRFVGEGKIVFADREYPDPGPGQLLLSVEANAICGTDREQYYAGSECVPGHEAAGTVIATGEGTHTSAGARGAVGGLAFTLPSNDPISHRSGGPDVLKSAANAGLGSTIPQGVA